MSELEKLMLRSQKIAEPISLSLDNLTGETISNNSEIKSCLNKGKLVESMIQKNENEISLNVKFVHNLTNGMQPNDVSSNSMQSSSIAQADMHPKREQQIIPKRKNKSLSNKRKQLNDTSYGQDGLVVLNLPKISSSKRGTNLRNATGEVSSEIECVLEISYDEFLSTHCTQDNSSSINHLNVHNASISRGKRVGNNPLSDIKKIKEKIIASDVKSVRMCDMQVEGEASDNLKKQEDLNCINYSEESCVIMYAHRDSTDVRMLDVLSDGYLELTAPTHVQNKVDIRNFFVSKDLSTPIEHRDEPVSNLALAKDTILQAYIGTDVFKESHILDEDNVNEIKDVELLQPLLLSMNNSLQGHEVECSMIHTKDTLREKLSRSKLSYSLNTENLANLIKNKTQVQSVREICNQNTESSPCKAVGSCTKNYTSSDSEDNYHLQIDSVSIPVCKDIRCFFSNASSVKASAHPFNALDHGSVLTVIAQVHPECANPGYVAPQSESSNDFKSKIFKLSKASDDPSQFITNSDLIIEVVLDAKISKKSTSNIINCLNKTGEIKTSLLNLSEKSDILVYKNVDAEDSKKTISVNSHPLTTCSNNESNVIDTVVSESATFYKSSTNNHGHNGATILLDNLNSSACTKNEMNRNNCVDVKVQDGLFIGDETPYILGNSNGIDLKICANDTISQCSDKYKLINRVCSEIILKPVSYSKRLKTSKCDSKAIQLKLKNSLDQCTKPKWNGKLSEIETNGLGKNKSAFVRKSKKTPKASMSVRTEGHETAIRINDEDDTETYQIDEASVNCSRSTILREPVPLIISTICTTKAIRPRLRTTFTRFEFIYIN